MKICYVCGKEVKGSDSVSITGDTHRHKSCAPGTKKWLQSDVAQNSDFKKFYDYIDGNGNGKKPKKPKKEKKKTPFEIWQEENKKFKEAMK